MVVLDDLSTGNRANLDGLDVTFVLGSITDDAALDEAFAGAGAVVHLAALGSVPRSVNSSKCASGNAASLLAAVQLTSVTSSVTG